MINLCELLLKIKYLFFIWHFVGFVTFTHSLHTLTNILRDTYMLAEWQTHTVCHCVWYIMYHCSYIDLVYHFVFFMFYFAFLNPCVLENVIFIRSILSHFVLDTEYHGNTKKIKKLRLKYAQRKCCKRIRY